MLKEQHQHPDMSWDVTRPALELGNPPYPTITEDSSKLGLGEAELLANRFEFGGGQRRP